MDCEFPWKKRWGKGFVSCCPGLEEEINQQPKDLLALLCSAFAKAESADSSLMVIWANGAYQITPQEDLPRISISALSCWPQWTRLAMTAPGAPTRQMQSVWALEWSVPGSSTCTLLSTCHAPPAAWQVCVQIYGTSTPGMCPAGILGTEAVPWKQTTLWEQNSTWMVTPAHMHTVMCAWWRWPAWCQR